MHCTIYIIFFALCISGFGEFKWVPRDRNGILHCVVEEETRQKIVRVMRVGLFIFILFNELA
jgi:hypothetical protein